MFRERIITEIANPELSRLFPDEQQHVTWALHPGHLSLGLFQEGRLVAYTTLFLPNTEQHLHDLHILQFARGRAAPRQVGHVGSIMVDPACRGLGLQRYLVSVRLIIAERLDRTHHFAFLAPANFYSWRNTLAMGARMIGFFDYDDSRYGPRSCFVTYRSPEPTVLEGEKYWVDSANIPLQRTLVAEGMVGSSFRLWDGRAQISYQREGMRSVHDAQTPEITSAP